ncbi:MAG: TerB family tellurite resistance protein [bacterium]
MAAWAAERGADSERTVRRARPTTRHRPAPSRPSWWLSSPLAAKVAKADGTVSPKEIATFDAFLRHHLGMSASDRRIAAQIFNQAKSSPLPASEFARQIRSIMAGQPERLRDLLALLMKIAYADGHFTQAEEILIRSITADLGLGDRDYEAARALFAPGDLESAYSLLGVDRSASEDEIKRNYRRLAREYHPDVLASKGLPEDFMKFANEKIQAINGAYGKIKESRGF